MGNNVLIDQDTIDAAITGFDDIQQAIIDMGEDVPNNTPVSEYPDKVRAISPPPVAGWQPHSDWIRIDQNVPDNSIVFLCTDTGGNGIFFQPVLNPTSGSYTVIINDGTNDIYTVTNPSNTVFQYSFAVGGGKPCSDGYTTYKVTLTGNLSSFGNVGAYRVACLQSILWAIINNANITNLAYLFFNTSRATYSCMLQNVTIMSCGNTALSGGSTFYYCTALQQISLPDNITTIGNNTFYSAGALQNFVFPIDATTLPNSMFYICYALREVTVKGPLAVTSDTGVFGSCYSLETINGSEYFASSNGSEIGISSMFSSCRSLAKLDLSGLLLSSFALAGSSAYHNALTNLWWNPASTFSSATSPQINLSYCSISDINLNDIFSRLPDVTASGATKKIAITDNPGAATCNPAIATAKGWTVTN